uniref:G_PROTEIN_RECEP_F1_2 domain-containing protein n=1 Tax=Toxocara canis TaxID=6265 RepID=A0A183VAQ7_TOXCA
LNVLNGVGLLLFILFRRIKHVAMNHKTVAHGNISSFVKNQSRFTMTMILSSVVTIALFVLPTCYQMAAQLFTHGSEIADVLALYLSYINAFNMVCVVVARQNDIKACLLGHLFGKHFSELVIEQRVVTVHNPSRKERSCLSKPVSSCQRVDLPKSVMP